MPKVKRLYKRSTPPGLLKAARAIGSKRALARALKIKPQAMNRWKRIPRLRILQIEQITGVPREDLAPELYRK